MRAVRWWAAGFVLAGLVGSTSAGVALDGWAGGLARRHLPAVVRAEFARALPAAIAPALLAVLLGLTLVQRMPMRARLRAWAALALAGAVEVLCKHLGLGVARPGPAAAWELAVPRWAGRISPPGARLWGELAYRLQPHGSFPSGHVLVWTVLGGFLLPWPGWGLPAAAALAAGVATVVTGAHTPTDVAGGACLAFAALAAAGRLDPRRPVTGRPAAGPGRADGGVRGLGDGGSPTPTAPGSQG